MAEETTIETTTAEEIPQTTIGFYTETATEEEKEEGDVEKWKAYEEPWRPYGPPTTTDGIPEVSFIDETMCAWPNRIGSCSVKLADCNYTRAALSCCCTS